MSGRSTPVTGWPAPVGPDVELAGRGPSDEQQHGMNHGEWRRWAPGHGHVDGDDVGYAGDWTKLGPKTPPERAQAPTATTFFGVGIASYAFSRGIRMWSVTGPQTSRTSASRGVGVMKNPRRCIL